MNSNGRRVFLTILATILRLQSADSVPVRLIGGSGPHEGRLEVYLNDRWGTVASSTFGTVEAAVVCRQLGFPGLAFATNSAVFGKGSGPISYTDLGCYGDWSALKATIDACSSQEVLVDYQGSHESDVGVVCNVTSPPPYRLVGGSGPHEGRMEVFFRGQWGSVCDSYPKWEHFDAHILCRHLGLPGGSVLPVSSTKFGSGEGPIWLSNLYCASTGYGYLGLHECGNQWGSEPTCDDHTHDIAVICNDSVSAQAIRLVGGSGPHEGRVEVRLDGKWGSVCKNALSWRPKNILRGKNIPYSAQSVCQQLGFDKGELYETSSDVFGPGTGWIWTSVKFCEGYYDFPCMHSYYGETEEEVHKYCDHSHDVGVICNVTTAPPIRLVDGSKPNEGRVEIQFTGEWGTICDRYFGIKEGTSVCRQLGYSEQHSNGTVSKNQFGNGELNRIWLDSTICVNDQPARIDMCVFHPLGQQSCNYSHDDAAAGLICEASTPPAPIRLVGGSGPHEGRLEIYHAGEWGTICVKDYHTWGRAEADVVCRQLGYVPDEFPSGASQATTAAIYGVSTIDKVWLDYVQCNPLREEFVLKDCNHSEWDGNAVCDHNTDVGVICGVASVLSPPLIRLIGGSGPHEGRLEIFFKGEWGTVCLENKWDSNKLPQTICSQIGMDIGSPKLVQSNVFGRGEGRIWLEKVRCDVGEFNRNDIGRRGIETCQHSAWGAVTCDHSLDVGVICMSPNSSIVGLVVGIVVGVLVVVILVVLLLYYCKIYKRNHRTPVPSSDVDMKSK